MRTLMTLAGSLLVATSVSAQTPAPPAPDECWPSSHLDKVVVRMTDGATRRGSLVCLGTEQLMLAERQSVSRLRLAEVARISKAPDPVWDGALKGASVGLLMLVLCDGHCPADFILRQTAGYALVGAAVDAIDTNAETIYRPSRAKRAAVGFRIRF